MSHQHAHQEKHNLAGELNSHVQVHAAKCYQCGKCTAGCPMAEDMEYPPSMVMRMLQTEEPQMDEKLLKSETIWVCIGCEMCLQRCPMEIDIPAAMDYMREKSQEMGISNPKSKKIIAFHTAFLNSVKNTGRLYEMGVVSEYKMKTGALFQDVDKAPTMFMKGKLALLPEKIKDRLVMKRIFDKTKNKH